jgi:ABC-type glycerol-3-phosphate transport system permease component
MIRDQGLVSKIWRFAVWAVAGLFIINLIGVIAAVVVNSFATRWLGTWLPVGLTTKWYFSAWKEFQLSSVVFVTFQIVFTVVIISGILGVTTAYALARRDFPGKRLVVLLFLLPLLIPPLTYGIPLATVLYQIGLGGSFWGVVLINLVPSLPFVVLVMIPFIEQIDRWRSRQPSIRFLPGASMLRAARRKTSVSTEARTKRDFSISRDEKRLTSVARCGRITSRSRLANRVKASRTG